MWDCSWGTTRHPHPAPTPRTRARSGKSSASLHPGPPSPPCVWTLSVPAPQAPGRGGCERRKPQAYPQGRLHPHAGSRRDEREGMSQCGGWHGAPGPHVGLMHGCVCTHTLTPHTLIPYSDTTHTHTHTPHPPHTHTYHTPHPVHTHHSHTHAIHTHIAHTNTTLTYNTHTHVPHTLHTYMYHTHST